MARPAAQAMLALTLAGLSANRPACPAAAVAFTRPADPFLPPSYYAGADPKSSVLDPRGECWEVRQRTFAGAHCAP